MKAIDRKLLRDLWAMRSQALAIALVIAGGVATFVMSLSTIDALRRTQTDFYLDYRFADVFASLKRAPEGLVRRIATIAGVEQIESRVVAVANLELPDFADPVVGQLISIAEHGASPLNRLYLRSGRLPDPAQDDEVVISEAFAEAHDYHPGATLAAILNGRRKQLTIVGIALSPEYIYQIQPGALFPDFKRFAVLWLNRTPLGTAYDMEGAFNNVVLTLTPRASQAAVIERLDRLLAPYGGLGAHGRADQLSHRYISQELHGLEQMATVFPVIFLGVAAFLLNVVINRLITLQREQIAALKAFGYDNIDIGLHYTKLVLAITAVGVSLGLAAGVWLGHGLSTIYMEFFRFPFLHYVLESRTVLLAGSISFIAALGGALYAVRRAALLPPAEAMRPQPPAHYRETWLERLGLRHVLSQPGRMIWRNIERRPVKALLTMLGIAFACAILMVGSFQEDAIDYMVNVQFGLSQREDMSVTFTEPTSRRALFELQRLPGVHLGEPFRVVAVRLRHGHRQYRTTIQGILPDSKLAKLLDRQLETVPIPASGLLLTDYLGHLLRASVGDRITVEVLQGQRPIRQVQVSGLVSQYVGVSAYMQLDSLNRLLREGDAISGVLLTVDQQQLQNINNRLRGTPQVAGSVMRKNSINSFYETLGENLLIFTFIITILAGIIAFGVVYNSARIALSERSRELASLRVLGFTRNEVAYILLGELGLLTLLAIAPGFVIGRAMCAYLVIQMESDLYRIPLVTETSTYAFAASVVLISTAVSAFIVWRKLGRLDLVAVLKTRE